MADNNQAAAAAASLPPVSKDKEKVSPPLPVVPVPAPVDEKVVKQMAVLGDVDVKRASSLSVSPPLAVMPADNNSKTTMMTTTTTTTMTTTPAVVAAPIQLMVCLCALVNAVVFAVTDVATTLIVNRSPCTKSTWLFACVTLTDAADAELSLLRYGELLCSAAAALAAPLHMLLTTRTTTTTTTSRMRSRWGPVDALAWLALAATAAIHCMEVASDRTFLAAKPGDTYIFVDVALNSVYLAVDLLAGVLLCCSPRCLELGEQQGDDDGEV